MGGGVGMTSKTSTYRSWFSRWGVQW